MKKLLTFMLLGGVLVIYYDENVPLDVLNDLARMENSQDISKRIIAKKDKPKSYFVESTPKDSGAEEKKRTPKK